MRSTTAIGMVLAAMAAAGNTAAAHTPKDALGAVAISQDGKLLVAAGDNRVLYVLDPASLEVTQRIPIGINPLDAVFGKDGAMLAILDTDDIVHVYASADWTEKTKIAGVQSMALSAASDTLAVLGSGQSVEGGYATPLTVYALGDGSVKLEASIKGDARYIAATPDGSGYAVMLDDIEDESEKKQETPADLEGVAKAEFEKKNDGSTAEIVRLDATGNETGRTKSWYTSNDSFIPGAYDGSTVYFFGYSNENLKLAADGTASLFKLAPSYLYGIGVGPDGKKVAAGSLRDGTLYNLGDGTSVEYELDSLEGWPEYFQGFAFAPDGSIYGSTTAYRLAHIGADGKIIAVKPIY